MRFVPGILAASIAAAFSFSAYAADSFPMDSFVKDVQEIVQIDSKTGHAEGVNQVIDAMAKRFQTLGWHVETPQVGKWGKGLIATNKAGDESYDVLLAAHADTVQPVGNAAKYPFTIKDGIAHGAGVADDKSSLMAVWWIVKDLPKSVTDKLKIGVIVNPAEEIGPADSERFLVKEGKKAKYALVYEPGRPGNGMVKARKGSMFLKFDFKGRSAHAGNNPQDGRNAVEAMAKAIPLIKAVADKYPDATLNADLVSGGSAANTIAENASVTFDLRFFDNKVRDQILSDIDGLIKKGFGADITVTFNPELSSALANTPESQKLQGVIDEAAKELGQPQPKWMAVGGASDANSLSGAGAAVACAMGVIGGDLHNPEKEWSDLNSAADRIALGKKVIEKIAEQKK